MSNLRLTYIPREDSTPEEETQALQRVFRFVLKCYERRNPEETGHGEVTTEVGHAEESPPESPAKGGGC